MSVCSHARRESIDVTGVWASGEGSNAEHRHREERKHATEHGSHGLQRAEVLVHHFLQRCRPVDTESTCGVEPTPGISDRDAALLK